MAITSIEIAPNATVLNVGSKQQLVAVGKRADGALVNLFNQVTWRVASGDAVASVDANGLVSRLTSGTAEIEAKAQGKTALLKISSDAQNLSLTYDNTKKKWPKVYIYLWTGENASKVEPVGKWPGTLLTAEENNLWSMVLEAKYLVNGSINVIFNNGAGGPANQTENLVAKESAIYDGMWTPKKTGTSAQLSVIDGVVKQGGSSFVAGTVVTVVANAPSTGTIFNGWGGESAAYIFTDPSKLEAQMVVPSGVASLSLQPLRLTDSYVAARNLYGAKCSNCHGSNGSNGPRASLDKVAEEFNMEQLIAKISEMPANCSGNRKGDCAYDIANLLINNQLKSGGCTGANCALDSRNLRLLTQEEYLNSLRDIFSMEFDPALLESVSKDSASRNYKTASFLVLDYYRALGYQMSATKAAEKIISAKSFFSLANNCGTDKVCVLNSLGKKVFRRPLTSAEVARYADLYDATDKGKAVIQAMLMSPYFLYRSEMGVRDSATGLYRLNNYEIAALLSYTFWGSTPDDSLLAAADSGNLDIRAQVNRLLDDPRADFSLRRFASGWLVDTKYGFAAATPELGASFNEETVRFAMETIKADKPYKTLLTADYTYANSQLASFYGSAAVSQGWQKSVFADGDPRRGTGILGHGSFLASRATSVDYPSPIKRGLFVRGLLMCQELPPPQKAGVSIPRKPTDNNRTAVSQHTSDTGCRGCHQYIDGIGFGFENFGSDAKFRTQEKLGNGQWQTIDATGSIKSLDSLEAKLDPNSEDVAYQTVPQLAELIANSNQGKACYSRQFYRYVVGREETGFDESIIQAYSTDVRDQGGMRKMMVDLAAHPSFILRRK